MSVSIDPAPGSLKALGSSLAHPDAPVVMLNLLRFAEFSHYLETDEDRRECSGREAYQTYLKHAGPKVSAAAGEVIYHGQVHAMLITPGNEHWDEVLIVRYPNYKAFVGMVMDPNYQKITHHRSAALADSRLWATQEP